MGMSIDEAKRRLLEVKACLHSLTEENQKDHEAFDMAISALKREQQFLDAGEKNERVEFYIRGRKFMVKEMAQ